jgi:small subunit ribosomal protein S6
LPQNVYEGMFILDSNRYGRDADGVSGRIATMIQDTGGEMLVSRLWDERRLAYPIKGHRRGTYWLTYFRLDSSRLAEIGRKCQLNESILRRLFLKVDPRIVDTLVTHARTATAPGAREDQDKKAPGAEVRRKQAAETTDHEGADHEGADDEGEDSDASEDDDPSEDSD